MSNINHDSALLDEAGARFDAAMEVLYRRPVGPLVEQNRLDVVHALVHFGGTSPDLQAAFLDVSIERVRDAFVLSSLMSKLEISVRTGNVDVDQGVFKEAMAAVASGAERYAVGRIVLVNVGEFAGDHKGITAALVGEEGVEPAFDALVAAAEVMPYLADITSRTLPALLEFDNAMLRAENLAAGIPGYDELVALARADAMIDRATAPDATRQEMRTVLQVLSSATPPDVQAEVSGAAMCQRLLARPVACHRLWMGLSSGSVPDVVLDGNTRAETMAILVERLDAYDDDAKAGEVSVDVGQLRRLSVDAKACAVESAKVRGHLIGVMAEMPTLASDGLLPAASGELAGMTENLPSFLQARNLL